MLLIWILNIVSTQGKTKNKNKMFVKIYYFQEVLYQEKTVMSSLFLYKVCVDHMYMDQMT